MAFDPSKYNIEEWLKLEDDNILQKVCNIFSDGLLVEQYKTRVVIVPAGNTYQYGSSRGKTAASAPALYRSFNYDDEGQAIASVPEIREWTQACEDAAVGAGPDPVEGDIPFGLKVASSNYLPGAASDVVEGGTAILVTKQLLPDEAIYLRHSVGSGESQARFRTLIDGSPIQTKRTWFGDWNVDMWFNTANGGILLEDEELIQLEVMNCGEDADFEGSIGFVVKEAP